MKLILKKYDDFIKENINNLYNDLLKYNSNISDKSIGDLSLISDFLTDRYIDSKIPFKDTFNFGGIDIIFNVYHGNKNHSFIKWNDFLNNTDRTINIEIKDDYDYNYLISIMIHELRHILDISNSMNDIIDSFDLEVNLRSISDSKYQEFIILVYISLEHELIARNNQIYPYIKFKNISKDKSISIIKNSNIWNSLELLSEFQHNKFINKFDIDELILLTNRFLEKVLLSNDRANNIDDIIIFYIQFEKYFKYQESEYKKELLSEIDKIYEVVKLPLYNEYIKYINFITEYYDKIKF
jgi:hypothetical protein